MPRTMKAEREAYYRKCLEHIVLPKLGVELLAELDAERLVSRKLAEALRITNAATHHLSGCCVGWQPPSPCDCGAQDIIDANDAALAQYTAGEDGGRERG